MTYHLQPFPETGRILVVDDEDINRAILRRLLMELGMEVLEAADGAQAVALVRERPVDLVLMDLSMPVMDGLESCRRIKQELGMVFLPVVFVTGHQDRESRLQAKSAGADDFLSKPVDRLELFARVPNLLKAKAFHDLQQRQTQHLEAELEKTRTLLLHADRLATLGNLAAGVSHELKNITTVLKATVNFVEDAASRGQPPDPADLRALHTVITHLETHGRTFLRYGRWTDEPRRREDLGALVRETLDMLAKVGRTRSVRVELDLPPGPVPVMVTRTHVEQVLVNLVGNAVDALQAQPAPSRRVKVQVQVRDGQAWCTVEDTGPGLAPEVREKLFQAAVTTKAEGRGNGLGMMVTRSILEGYGGSVAVESRPGQGARFMAALPLMEVPG